jgi:hypothetical protein
MVEVPVGRPLVLQASNHLTPLAIQHSSLPFTETKWFRLNSAPLAIKPFSPPSLHAYRDQMVEIAIGWGSEFEGSEADVVQGLVVDAERLVGVLNQLRSIS